VARWPGIQCTAMSAGPVPEWPHQLSPVAESFAQERAALEEQWDRGEDISTEDLRVALQRYRSFFQRLLAA
jgi:hypothetical protein